MSAFMFALSVHLIFFELTTWLMIMLVFRKRTIHNKNKLRYCISTFRTPAYAEFQINLAPPAPHEIQKREHKSNRPNLEREIRGLPSREESSGARRGRGWP